MQHETQHNPTKPNKIELTTIACVFVPDLDSNFSHATEIPTISTKMRKSVKIWLFDGIYLCQFWNFCSNFVVSDSGNVLTCQDWDFRKQELSF